MPLDLESMPLPTGYFWRSLPADDRFRAVLCYGTPTNLQVVRYCNTRKDALDAMDEFDAALRGATTPARLRDRSEPIDNAGEVLREQGAEGRAA